MATNWYPKKFMDQIRNWFRLLASVWFHFRINFDNFEKNCDENVLGNAVFFSVERDFVENGLIEDVSDFEPNIADGSTTDGLRYWKILFEAKWKFGHSFVFWKVHPGTYILDGFFKFLMNSCLISSLALFNQ